MEDEILIVVGTSETVLPRMITMLENAGRAKSAAGQVVPTGYDFNLDRTPIYLTIDVTFVTRDTTGELGTGEEWWILLALTLTSRGPLALSGLGFIMLGAPLSSVGTVDVARVRRWPGVDHFICQFRSMTNLVRTGVGRHGRRKAGARMRKGSRRLVVELSRRHGRTSREIAGA